jgi:hypothetical protein
MPLPLLRVLALLAAVFLPAAFADNLITAADLPADAPRFADFPAVPYTGPNAEPDLRGDRRSMQYRTQLRAWARERPDFAGHYIVASWGCGTGCTQLAIIDAVSGRVFHPVGLRTNSIVDVDAELLGDDVRPARRADFGALRYRVDSRLLVLVGTPENQPAQRGISYYVWEGEGLRRIRFVAKPG